ncbi:class II aldolase/adducin family protein [Tsukamurella spumae]|uniref:Class II aldolase/adducin family protein n=1 Tax=Tsukamurella spumae TaxID=44753 RepID=A0A846X5I6_9ACTN|nr:class II aldolase/adducin family protein [Tsukamurella spumae]NKY19776.1 class II aldolase/adducin family protein [Tsukamurella spumae]
MTPADLVAETVAAARVVAALGIVGPFGHVSARIDEKRIIITPAAPLASATPDELVTVELDASELPPRAPGEAWIHLGVYHSRADVGGICRAIPESSFAAGAVYDALRPVHGQAALLGPTVPVHPTARLVRDREAGVAVAGTLDQSDAVVLRGNGAVTVGASPGLAVARMHLLDTACRVRLAAGRDAHELDADEIAAWRAAGPPLLQRLWNYLNEYSAAPAAIDRAHQPERTPQ